MFTNYQAIPNTLIEIVVGKFSEELPKLAAHERVPASLDDVMRARLAVLEEGVSDHVRKNLWGTCIYTGDASVYDPENNMKFVPNAGPLRTCIGVMEFGALVLDPTEYQQLPGVIFTKDCLAKHTGIYDDVFGFIGKPLRKGEARDNPLWIAFSRGDKTLLGSYEDAAFERAVQEGHTEAMGIFLHQGTYEHHQIRPLVMSGGFGNHYSLDAHQAVKLSWSERSKCGDCTFDGMVSYWRWPGSPAVKIGVSKTK